MEEDRRFALDLQLFAGEATEPATPRRREEARKKGHVPRSHDLVTALLLLALMYLLRWFGRNMLEVMGGQTQEFLARPPGEITPATLEVISLRLIWSYLQALWPVFLGALAVSILGNGLQVGMLFQTYSLQPDLNRINPLAGARRIFSKGALVELLKSLLKVLIVGWVAYLTVRQGWKRLLLTSEVALAETLILVGQMTFELGVRVALAFLILGVLDYLYQRWEYEQGLRMTRQEVKDEFKQTEGDPQVRSRIRQRQRQLAMRRMMSQVPTADVVITNPTELAVALRYDAETMAAPVVVAKGADYVARRIRQIAAEHGVVIVENKPLAQALYRTTEVGMAIPVELYQAVAEVLAFVYRLKRRPVNL